MTIYVSDSYTDTDAVALPSHTPETDVQAGGWVAVSGSYGGVAIVDFNIASNKAAANNAVNNTPAINVIDAGVYNLEMLATVTFRNQVTSTQDEGFFFRYVDLSNYWRLTFTSDGTGGLALEKVVSGAVTLIDRFHMSGLENTTHTLRLRADGNDCWVGMDSFWICIPGVLSTGTSIDTATYAGIIGSSRSGSHTRFDSLVISSVTAETNVDPDKLLWYRADDTQYLMTTGLVSPSASGTDAVAFVLDRTNHGHALYLPNTTTEAPIWHYDDDAGLDNRAYSDGDGSNDSLDHSDVSLKTFVDKTVGCSVCAVFRYVSDAAFGDSHRDILRLYDSGNTERVSIWQFGGAGGYGAAAYEVLVSLQGVPAYYWPTGWLPGAGSNDWHFVGISFDGTTKEVNLNLDGVLVDTSTITNTWNADLKRFTMHSGDAYESDSRIAEVKIFDRPLTAAELNSQYNYMFLGLPETVAPTLDSTMPTAYDTFVGDLLDQKTLSLAANIDDVEATIQIIENLGDLEMPQYFFVGGEIIYAANKSGDTLTGCVRGAEGSTAASHTAGDKLDLVIAGTHLTHVRDAAIASQYYQGLVGLDAGKEASPEAGNAYFATDTKRVYVCLTAGAWTIVGGRQAHDELSSLSADDHTQYHITSRAVTWHDGLSGDHVTGGDAHTHSLYGVRRISAGATAAKPAVPSYIGQVFYDTTTNELYIAKGTSGAGDWKKITGAPAGTVVAFLEADITTYYAGACPSGWSRLTAADGRMIKGAPGGVTSPLNTGGASTHTHSITAVISHYHDIASQAVVTNDPGNHTHTINVQGSGAYKSLGLTVNQAETTEATSSSGDHSHTVTWADTTTNGTKRTSDNADAPATATSGSGTNWPAYQEVILCVKD